MKKILSKIALFFRCIADFLDGSTKPAHPLPSPVIDPSDNKRMRLRTLLSRADLAADEQEELSKLVSGLEGDIVFLDPPLHPAAKEEL